MSKKVVRYLREKFGKRKKALPKGLEFLEGISFHAIAEHKGDGERKQTIVEFTPRVIRSIVAKSRECDDLVELLDEANNNINSLLSWKDNLIEKLKSSKDEYDVLAHNYIQMCKNESEGDVKVSKSPRSYHDVIEDKGTALHGPPIQGGLPSLGKKR